MMMRFANTCSATIPADPYLPVDRAYNVDDDDIYIPSSRQRIPVQLGQSQRFDGLAYPPRFLVAYTSCCCCCCCCIPVRLCGSLVGKGSCTLSRKSSAVGIDRLGVREQCVLNAGFEPVSVLEPWLVCRCDNECGRGGVEVARRLWYVLYSVVRLVPVRIWRCRHTWQSILDQLK